MVDGIAFYALYKSRVLIIPCKADDFCLSLPCKIWALAKKVDPLPQRICTHCRSCKIEATLFPRVYT